jgi:hypothetical protein
MTSAANTYIEVVAKEAFSLGTGAKLACSIDDIRARCTLLAASKQVNVYIPDIYPLASGTTYEVVIYSNGADQGYNGLQLTASNKVNLLTVSGYVGGTLSFSGSFTSYIINSHFTSLKISSLHRTADMPNAFTVTFTLNTNLKGGNGNPDNILVEFPTKDYNGNSMFKDDLGTGAAELGNVPCDNFVGLTAMPSGFKCKLHKGNTLLGVPARIYISGFKNLGSGSTASFILSNIYNPRTYSPSDTTTMELWMSSLWSEIKRSWLRKVELRRHSQQGLL